MIRLILVALIATAMPELAYAQESPPSARHLLGLVPAMTMLAGAVMLFVGLVYPRSVFGSRGSRARSAAICITTIVASFIACAILYADVTPGADSADEKMGATEQESQTRPPEPISVPAPSVEDAIQIQPGSAKLAESPLPTVREKPAQMVTYRTSPSGQPLCADMGQLQEYILAAMKRDQQWMDSLASCATVKGGLKVVVIEEYPSDSDIGHVDKVRVFGPKGSAIGYTLNIGLIPAK